MDSPKLIEIIDVADIPANGIILYNQRLVNSSDLSAALAGLPVKEEDVGGFIGLIPVEDLSQSAVQMVSESELNNLGWYRKDNE